MTTASLNGAKYLSDAQVADLGALIDRIRQERFPDGVLRGLALDADVPYATADRLDLMTQSAYGAAIADLNSALDHLHNVQRYVKRAALGLETR